MIKILEVMGGGEVKLEPGPNGGVKITVSNYDVSAVARVTLTQHKRAELKAEL
jgi:hypothetical protein